MRNFYIVIVVLFVVLLAIPQTGNTIPAFARKYGFNCNMCHTSFTKLNDFGQRFRENGYQIPGQQGLEKNVFEIAPPLSFRLNAGMQLAHSKDRGNTSGFNLYGFDLLAAGVFHENVSFLLIYTPRVDEPTREAYRPGGIGFRQVPMQPGSLESANIVFSNLLKEAFNLRIGRFEPEYHGISSKRSYYLAQGYEIYDFHPTMTNQFIFGDNQMGIEATGNYKIGFHYGLGVVNGSGPYPDNNKYKDVYLAMHQVIGRGEGQSAGQRVGVFGYFGWQPTFLFEPDYYSGPSGEIAAVGNKPFRRIGGDVSLNWTTLNLRGFFMQGVDDKGLNSFDWTKSYTYTGGFVELDYAGLGNNRLLLSGLFNWVTPPSYNNYNKITAISGLVRYYLGDWMAVNVALHAEYTHKQVGEDNPLKEDVFTALVDFDF